MAKRINIDGVEDLLLLLLYLDCHIEAPACPSIQLRQQNRLHTVNSAILQQSHKSMGHWLGRRGCRERDVGSNGGGLVGGGYEIKLEQAELHSSVNERHVAQACSC